MIKDRRIDAWGQVIADPEAAFRLALQGVDIWSLAFDNGPEIDRYNDLCERFDKSDYLISAAIEHKNTPQEEHDKNSKSWLIPNELKTINVREFILSMCSTQDQKNRVNEEMDLYEDRGLVPLLQLMIYLVDNFRERNIVWGVGRGSSVASYVLYLIGVHKVDSLKYGLSIYEFLK